MPIFITGTDTNVGKTLISAWLCYHTQWSYFKPIQTGFSLGRDTQIVETLSKIKTYPESYSFELAASPHLAAQKSSRSIDFHKISIPTTPALIIEGAGGILVPINQAQLMVDLISHINQQVYTPVVLVARGSLGTINHTLLSLEALRSRSIPILGIIMNGEDTLENKAAIEHYGKVTVLAQIPTLSDALSTESLASIPLPETLKNKLAKLLNNSHQQK